MFPFPIGIQLFNRPDYARRVLNSIKSQNIKFLEDRITILIDGYSGSVYEIRKNRDFTREISSLAHHIFPKAKIIKLQQNHGIAETHNILQEEVFSLGDKWAAFFEEDVVLKSNYLKELHNLIEVVNTISEVSKVACFQIIRESLNLSRGFEGFYAGTGTKAYAERIEFFQDKQEIILKFIEIQKKSSTNGKSEKNSLLSANIGAEGHLIPYFQKDSLIESFLHFQKKLHVVTKPDLATDIGFNGIHNFTVKPLNPISIKHDDNSTLKNRKDLLINSLDSIKSEARAHIINNYREILEGYYISTSRRKMLNRIFRFARKD